MNNVNISMKKNNNSSKHIGLSVDGYDKFARGSKYSSKYRY